MTRRKVWSDMEREGEMRRRVKKWVRENEREGG